MKTHVSVTLNNFDEREAFHLFLVNLEVRRGETTPPAEPAPEPDITPEKAKRARKPKDTPVEAPAVVEAVPTPPEPETPAEAIVAQPEPGVEPTPPPVDVIRKALLDFVKVRGAEQAKAIIASFGVASISDVPEARRSALLAELTAAV